MSLAGISAGIASSFFSAGGASLQLQSSSSRTQGGAGGAANDTISLSGQGQFISKLQALKASDPQKFKQILSQAATDLRTAAGHIDNSTRAQSLSNLATKFQNAADSGDISHLRPATHSNRVQKAYGASQPDGMQELFNVFSHNQPTGDPSYAFSVNTGSGSSGGDPHAVLQNVANSLSKI